MSSSNLNISDKINGFNPQLNSGFSKPSNIPSQASPKIYIGEIAKIRRANLVVKFLLEKLIFPARKEEITNPIK